MALGFAAKLAIGAGISLLGGLLRRRGRTPIRAQKRPNQIVSEGEPTYPAQWVFGESRVAGVEVYRATEITTVTDAPFHSEEDPGHGLNLHRFFVLSEGMCEQLTGIEIGEDDYYISDLESELFPRQFGHRLRAATAERWNGRTTRGGSWTAYPKLKADGTERPEPFTPTAGSLPWPDMARLDGKAWIHLVQHQPPPEQGDTVWPDQLQPVSFVLKGMHLPIPGPGHPDTWPVEYTDNAAAVRFFLESRLAGVPIERFDLASVRAAYRVCDRSIELTGGLSRVRVAFRQTQTNVAPAPPPGRDFPPPAPWQAARPDLKAAPYTWVCFSYFNAERNRWRTWRNVKRYATYLPPNGDDDPDRPTGVIESAITVMSAARVNEDGDFELDPDPDTLDVSPRRRDGTDGMEEGEEEDPTNPTGEDPNPGGTDIPRGEVNNEDWKRLLLETGEGRLYSIAGAVGGEDLENLDRVRDEMDFAWAGRVVLDGGRLFFTPGSDTNPVAVFDNSTGDTVSATPSPRLTERINAATMGLSESRVHRFRPWNDGAEIQHRPAINRDGRKLCRDLGDRPFVTSPTRAAILLTILLRAADANAVYTRRERIRDNAEALSIRPGQRVVLNDPLRNLNPVDPDSSRPHIGNADGRYMRVLARKVDLLGGTVDFALVEHFDGTYDPVPSRFPRLEPSVFEPGAFVGDPSNLQLEDVAYVDADGKTRVRIDVTWASQPMARTLIQWRPVVPGGIPGAEYTELDRTRSGENVVITETPPWGHERSIIDETSYAQILGVQIGVTYEVRIRHISRAGFQSAWSDPATLTVTGDLTPPGRPENVVLTAGFGRFVAQFSRPPERDYDVTALYVRPSGQPAPELPTAYTSNTYIEIESDPNVPVDVDVVHLDRERNESERVTGTVTPLVALQEGERLLYDYAFNRVGHVSSSAPIPGNPNRTVFATGGRPPDVPSSDSEIGQVPTRMVRPGSTGVTTLQPWTRAPMEGFSTATFTPIPGYIVREFTVWMAFRTAILRRDDFGSQTRLRSQFSRDRIVSVADLEWSDWTAPIVWSLPGETMRDPGRLFRNDAQFPSPNVDLEFRLLDENDEVLEQSTGRTPVGGINTDMPVPDGVESFKTIVRVRYSGSQTEFPPFTDDAHPWRVIATYGEDGLIVGLPQNRFRADTGGGGRPRIRREEIPGIRRARSIFIAANSKPTAPNSTDEVPAGWSRDATLRPTSTARQIWQLSVTQNEDDSWPNWNTADPVLVDTYRTATAYLVTTNGGTPPTPGRSGTSVPAGWLASEPSLSGPNDLWLWSSDGVGSDRLDYNWSQPVLVRKYEAPDVPVTPVVETRYATTNTPETPRAPGVHGAPNWVTRELKPTASSRAVWRAQRPAGGDWAIALWNIWQSEVFYLITNSRGAPDRPAFDRATNFVSGLRTLVKAPWSATAPNPTSLSRHLWAIRVTGETGTPNLTYGAARILRTYTETTFYIRTADRNTMPAAPTSWTPGAGWSTSRPRPTAAERAVWAATRAGTNVPGAFTWTVDAAPIDEFTDPLNPDLPELTQTAWRITSSSRTPPAPTTGPDTNNFSRARPTPGRGVPFLWKAERTRPAGPVGTPFGAWTVTLAGVFEHYFCWQVGPRDVNPGSPGAASGGSGRGEFPDIPTGWRPPPTRPGAPNFNERIWISSIDRVWPAPWDRWGVPTEGDEGPIERPREGPIEV